MNNQQDPSTHPDSIPTVIDDCSVTSIKPAFYLGDLKIWKIVLFSFLFPGASYLYTRRILPLFKFCVLATLACLTVEAVTQSKQGDSTTAAILFSSFVSYAAIDNARAVLYVRPSS